MYRFGNISWHNVLVTLLHPGLIWEQDPNSVFQWKSTHLEQSRENKNSYWIWSIPGKVSTMAMYEWTNSKMAIIWYCGNGIGLAGVQECQSSVVALSTKRESSEGVRPDPTHSHTLFQTTQFSCSFNSMEREISITKKEGRKRLPSTELFFLALLCTS